MSVCSYTICIVLAIIVVAISIGIGAYFVYSRWYLKKVLSLVLKVLRTRVKFGTHTQTI